MVSWGWASPSLVPAPDRYGMCNQGLLSYIKGCLLNRGEGGGNGKVVSFFLFPKTPFQGWWVTWNTGETLFQGWWVTWPWKLIQRGTPLNPSNILRCRNKLFLSAEARCVCCRNYRQIKRKNPKPHHISQQEMTAIHFGCYLIILGSSECFSFSSISCC